MRIVSTNNATIINHQDTDYVVDSDGVFDLPTDVAEHLLAFPGWLEEYVYLDQQAAKAAVDATTPQAMAERLARIEAHVSEPSTPEPAKRARPKKTVG